MFYVYILASKPFGVLYVGSTSDLVRRTWEHKTSAVKSFSKKYNVHLLVYYECHDDYSEAARREMRLKNWPRQWKLDLISSMNPDWRDLYDEICE